MAFKRQIKSIQKTLIRSNFEKFQTIVLNEKLFRTLLMRHLMWKKKWRRSNKIQQNSFQKDSQHWRLSGSTSLVFSLNKIDFNVEIFDTKKLKFNYNRSSVIMIVQCNYRKVSNFPTTLLSFLTIGVTNFLTHSKRAIRINSNKDILPKRTRKSQVSLGPIDWVYASDQKWPLGTNEGN